ncbi:MAG: hypothetical protein ACP5I6_04190 [Caldisphaera sp.]|jgi:dolichyl-diphosphooligosaccharide--protein glycosyltransferase
MSRKFESIVLSKKIQSLVIYTLLAIIVGFATYIRLLPAINFGLRYLNEADPWERYWLSLYFYNHNLLGFSGLKDIRFWWYPWGRNFLKTEYLGMSWLTAFIAKILGYSQSYLTSILGLLPVAFSVIAMLGAFFAIYKITNSKIAGLVSSSVIALYPVILLDQTFANFPGKRIFGFALISWFFYFFARSLKENSKKGLIVYSLLAGIFGGLVSWFWGGYEYIALLLAVFMLLEPFLIKPNKNSLFNYLLIILGYTLIIASSPTAGLSFYTHSVGLGLIGVFILYIIEEEIGRLKFLNKINIKSNFDLKLHIWFLIVAFGVLLSVIVTGFVSLPSRVLLALGITPSLQSVVSLTVAEYQSVTFGQAMSEYGVLFFISIIGLIMELYYIFTKKDKITKLEILKLSLFIYGFVFMYASINEAYFLSSAAFFLSLSTGATVGTFFNFKKINHDKKAKKIIEKPNYSIVAFGAILAIVVLGLAVDYTRSDYNTLKLMAPDIETSYLGPISVPSSNGRSMVIAPINSAWLDALSYINNYTDKKAVVVSWWDYGYWIGVLGNRTTVVDGSTINGTQIAIVADTLTSPINQSLGYLTLFRVPSNDTYLIVYDVFIGIYSNSSNTAVMFPYPTIYSINPSSRVYGITYGLGDIAKSYQMLRIANKVNPIYGNPLTSSYSSISTYNNYVYYQFPAFYGSPKNNVSTTLDTTIYNLMFYGIGVLNKYGYFGTGAKFLENVSSFTPAAISYIDPTTGNIAFQPVSVPNPTQYYELVKVFVSIPYSWNLQGTENTYFYAVVVFLYKANIS